TTDFFSAPDADDPRAELSETELSADDVARIELATDAAAQAAAFDARERELLEAMTRIAEAARGQRDPRIAPPFAWVRKHGLEADGKTWKEIRVLVFTELADTKRYIAARLREELADTDRIDERIATFHGGMSEEGRLEVQRAFNTTPTDHPLRVLIAT